MRPPTGTSTSSHGVSAARCSTGSGRRSWRSSSPANRAPRRGSIGRGLDGVAVYDSESLTEREAAEFDADGALINADKAIGELVNTHGGGFFSGCYNDPNATSERMRGGMFRSGDLGYRDADGSIRPGAPPTGCATTRSSPPLSSSSPRRATRPAPEGVAALGADQQRPAGHRDEQDTRARTESQGATAAGGVLWERRGRTHFEDVAR